jgi:hypothetical protein
MIAKNLRRAQHAVPLQEKADPSPRGLARDESALQGDT